jgi:hypothetical protein
MPRRFSTGPDPLGRLSKYRRHAWLPLCLAAGLFSIAMGQDASWDLQNYHFYNGFVLFHPGRRHDIDIAQTQTFLNPSLDAPLYLLTCMFPRAPRAVAFCMGLPYGVLAWFTICIATRLLGGAVAGAWAICIACVLGLTGAAAISQVGLATNEVLVACLVAGGLHCLLHGIDTPAAGIRPFLVAGLLTGIAMGGKLTATPYAIGLAAAVLAALPKRRLLSALPALGLAGVGGVLLTGGFWMAHLWHLYANPIFPFDNQIFKSPWAGPWGYQDTRFLPRSLAQALFYPFWWLRPTTMLVTDAPFADPRFAAVFLAAPIALLAAGLRGCLETQESASFLKKRSKKRLISTGFATISARCSKESKFFCFFLFTKRSACFALDVFKRTFIPKPLWRALIMFWLASYIVWEKLFSIYRYAIPLEIVGGILVIGAIRALLPGHAGLIAAAALTVGIGLATDYPDWGRIAFQPRAIPASLPPIAPHTLVVSSDAGAVSFVAALAPENTVFVGGNGNFSVPDDSLTWRLITSTIANWRGPLDILGPAAGDPAGLAALAANFGIAPGDDCQPIHAAWNDDALQLCRADRIVMAPDQQPTLNLSFSRGAEGLADAGPGWAPPEDWGMWSAAPDATLHLPVNPLNTHPLLLTVLCFSIPSAASPGRHLDIYAGDIRVAQWRLDKFPEIFSAVIPAAPGATQLTLRFHTSDPIIPPGAGPDLQLGIALQHLTLQQAP